MKEFKVKKGRLLIDAQTNNIYHKIPIAKYWKQNKDHRTFLMMLQVIILRSFQPSTILHYFHQLISIY